jgi:hypothetical protein
MNKMDYGMFSAEGNKLVHRVVSEAKVQGYDWPKTYRHLVLLAKAHPAKAGEALDTEVREMVFVAIGADKRGEEFYGV